MICINSIKYKVSFPANPDILVIHLETCSLPYLNNISIDAVKEARRFSNPIIGGKI
jgi:hypothetical protein